MRRIRNLFTTLLVLLLIGATTWGGWLLLDSRSKESLQQTTSQDSANSVKPAVMVTLGTVADRQVERTVEAMGTLNAWESIAISAKVAGHVKKLHCDVSDRVQPSATLLEIDPTDYDLAVRQAERSLQVELSRIGLQSMPPTNFDIKQLPTVKHAQSRLGLSQATAQRTKDLVASRASSQADLDNALADLRMAEADFENQLLVAQASLATISMRNESLSMSRQEQSNATVRSPEPTQPVPFTSNDAVFAVAARKVSEGSYVRQGTELFQLVIDSTLRLKVPVPERFANIVQAGQTTRVHVASQSEPILGQVTRINPTIDPASRAFEVEIVIDNRQGLLKPGGFAQAEIVAATNHQAVVVPWESVVTYAGVTKVFLVEHGLAKEVQVTLGRQGQDWVEIVTPTLISGSRIVTGGQNALADGVPIQERVHVANKPQEPAQS